LQVWGLYKKHGDELLRTEKKVDTKEQRTSTTSSEEQKQTTLFLKQKANRQCIFRFSFINKFTKTAEILNRLKAAYRPSTD
jgi:hypothetical protein